MPEGTQGYCFPVRVRLPIRQHSLSLALLSWVLLTVALSRLPGSFVLWIFLLVLFSFAALGVSVAVLRNDDHRHLPSRVLAAAALLAVALNVSVRRHGYDIQWTGYELLVTTANLIVFAGIGVCYFSRLRSVPMLRTGFFIGAVLLALAVRIPLPAASPSPVIDVFSVQQHAAEELLAGRSPYASEAPNPYTGARWRRFDFTVARIVPYPPAHLYLLLPFFTLLHDVRWLMISADIAVAAILWLLLRRRQPVAGELLALCSLFHPATLVVLERSWTEPVIAAVIALTVAAYHWHPRGILPSLLLGLATSLKQYLVPLFPLWLFVERRSLSLLSALGIGLLTIIPFLIGDPVHFLSATVFHSQALSGFRSDSLSAGSSVFFMTGLKMPSWSGAVFAVIAMGIAGWLLRRAAPMTAWLGSLCLSLFALFALGSRGYLNYYWLLSALLLLFIAERERTKGDET